MSNEEQNDFDIVYEASPTAAAFYRCNADKKFIIGPVGGGKSHACHMNMLKVGTDQRAHTDGIRYSRIVCIRNTYDQLVKTVIDPFLGIFKPGIHGTYKKSEKEFLIEINDIHCQVWFIAIDRPEDKNKLLSLATTAVFVEEFREVDREIVEEAYSRCGRYPPVRLGGAIKNDGSVHSVLFGSTNPPDFDSKWGTFVQNPDELTKVFFQPSGLSAEAENLKWLPKNYYQRLVKTMAHDQNWINIHVHGQLGQSKHGQPVYPGFSLTYHVAKEDLDPVITTHSKIIIGMDFGLNPSAVIGQMNGHGQVIITDELTSDGLGVLRFGETLLKPLLARKYPGAEILLIGDPSGVNRSQTDERTVYDVLRNLGFRAIPASTNRIGARVSSVDGLLMRQIDSKPALLISPNCHNLIMGFRGGYRYKKKKNGEFEDEGPEKNSYSHIHDALQYFALYFNNPTKSIDNRRKIRQIKSVRNRSWTE